ncbi:hypothetical protein EVAR_88143_1 [Eumeta japonica]|uniref:Uncharacterized protein n=1 Tax=Eumeta variegata TaxID=151549 RepID=A0A4C1WSG9_EUMVA|nr:hypothetical protein EVAR_88143_1 [Eumeta japonica]
MLFRYGVPIFWLHHQIRPPLPMAPPTFLEIRADLQKRRGTPVNLVPRLLHASYNIIKGKREGELSKSSWSPPPMGTPDRREVTSALLASREEYLEEHPQPQFLNVVTAVVTMVTSSIKPPMDQRRELHVQVLRRKVVGCVHRSAVPTDVMKFARLAAAGAGARAAIADNNGNFTCRARVRRLSAIWESLFQVSRMRF